MAKEYEVLRITQLTRLADGGGIETYRAIQIKSKGGVVEIVNIDEANFSPERSVPILTKAAQNADAIKASGG